jgi:hypothetical protein
MLDCWNPPAALTVDTTGHRALPLNMTQENALVTYDTFLS